MLFNSLAYAVFLPLACLAYYLAPQKRRWAVLLAFSCWFYMSWNAKLILLIAFTVLVSYGTALGLEALAAAGHGRWRRPLMLAGVGACLACLFFFKYFDFFAASGAAALGAFGFTVQPPTLKLMLPVGISFYTFQTLSYILDVYHGRMRAERHLGYYALYVSFFPQLVAGPIERADRLLPQLRAPHRWERARFSAGLRRILVGMFKKVVIADFLAGYVNAVYNDLPGKGGLTLIAATALFGVQIYCDFSGYSEIAIGSAELLGIRLVENFDAPYFARSVQGFWRRWHISLTTWFTDYVYIPLGGSRCARAKHWRNLLLTFLLSGLWHGADWTFVLWGLYHGLLLCAETLYMPRVERLQTAWAGTPRGAVLTALRTLYTCAAVTFGWIFFRANSVADLGYVLQNLSHGLNPLRLPEYLALGGMDTAAMPVAALLLALLAAYDWAAAYREPPLQTLCRARPWQRVAVYYLLGFCVLAFACSRGAGAAADFLYFQF